MTAGQVVQPGRRLLLGSWMVALPVPWQLPAWSAVPSAGLPAAVPPPVLPRALARFSAGVPGQVDLAPWLPPDTVNSLCLSLRANLAAASPEAATPAPLLALTSQFPEYTLRGTVLHFDGGAAGALTLGASAVRLQLELAPCAAAGGAVWVSNITSLQVDSPLSVIKCGLDQWPSFAALSEAVQGTAPAGSAPRGRTDLIGKAFELTPGMLSEPFGAGTTRAAPVAVIQFPCTVKALDPSRRPVLRSVSGERDIVQVAATLLPPIPGEVVLQDLVLRDNRSWYNTGEAGVRIKDTFAGRSVRIERCEFVRCQNAVAGGSRGQALRVIDCRIVDCGVGDQAHGLYVSPEWFEFFGNHVLQSSGNRLARAHLLKSRALSSRILGNRFDLNDNPGSYLIDLSNGGDAEVGGNLLNHGPASDNTSATLIAYAPEGPREDRRGRDLAFSADRRFRLVVRNNTVQSAFAGPNRVLVVDVQTGRWPDGSAATTWPEPLQFDDNLVQAAGPLQLVLRRERGALGAREEALPGLGARNTVLASAGRAVGLGQPNVAGAYAARRFTGHTPLGTGSEAFIFNRRGAG